MKYKIYFLFLACNVLFGSRSIPMLQPAKDPISYEAWKTASYEDVAKDVAPAILNYYKIQLEAREKAIPGEEEELQKLYDQLLKPYNGKKCNMSTKEKKKFSALEAYISQIKQEKFTIAEEKQALQKSYYYNNKRSKLIEHISTGMKACANHKQMALIKNSYYTMPHLALARLVNCNDHKKIYYLPYIFISGCGSVDIYKRLNAFEIVQPEEFFCHVSRKKLLTSALAQKYAHSERAIFDTLSSLCLPIKKDAWRYGDLILQVKNSLPMCDNCQRLWLNDSYEESGKYASSGQIIDVWAKLPFLSKIEVSRKEMGLVYNCSINKSSDNIKGEETRMEEEGG